jgi:hypothetical protein
LRERLKEAKGIGTPATRAEIIGGLKKQGFLIAQGRPSALAVLRLMANSNLVGCLTGVKSGNMLNPAQASL